MKIIEHVSKQIKDAISGAEGRMSKRISSSLKDMQARLGKDCKVMVQKMVERHLQRYKENDFVAMVVREINATHVTTDKMALVTTGSKSHNGTRSENATTNDVQNVLEKFTAMTKQMVATRELDFGFGLVLVAKELLNIPICITPTRPVVLLCACTCVPVYMFLYSFTNFDTSPTSPQVMDSCVMVFTENLLSSLDPTPEPCADFMPCRFAGHSALNIVEAHVFAFFKWENRFCHQLDRGSRSRVTPHKPPFALDNSRQAMEVGPEIPWRCQCGVAQSS
ncbi:unnamed protein product [Microthlaspi erraticum]|uniref:Uncharacterized protein n=1 Tax=Microthlaspi erraticum TaxID=1685480 RepID=A0A6D2IHS6_9BRAS|nr:unnamed protein product [Microthlaspi erraticum]